MKNLLQNLELSNLIKETDSYFNVTYKGDLNKFFRHSIAGVVSNATGYPLYKEEVIKFRDEKITPHSHQLHNIHSEILAGNFKFTPENIDLILDCFHLCLHPDTITDEIVTLFNCEQSDLEHIRDVIINAKQNNQYEDLNELMLK